MVNLITLINIINIISFVLINLVKCKMVWHSFGADKSEQLPLEDCHNAFSFSKCIHLKVPSTYRLGKEIITGEKTINNWRILAIIVSSNFHANTSQKANIQAPTVQPVSLKIKISVWVPSNFSWPEHPRIKRPPT